MPRATGSIKNFNLVTGFLINDFTIDKLSYALIYFNIAECSSLITMQRHVYSNWKGFTGLSTKSGFTLYCGLYVGFPPTARKRR